MRSPKPLIERLADELAWWINWATDAESVPPRSFESARREGTKLLGELDPRRVGKPPREDGAAPGQCNSRTEGPTSWRAEDLPVRCVRLEGHELTSPAHVGFGPTGLTVMWRAGAAVKTGGMGER